MGYWDWITGKCCFKSSFSKQWLPFLSPSGLYFSFSLQFSLWKKKPTHKAEHFCCNSYVNCFRKSPSTANPLSLYLRNPLEILPGCCWDPGHAQHNTFSRFGWAEHGQVPHVLLSTTQIGNSALPQHHVNSWSLTCEATRCLLIVSCLHSQYPHVIFLPSDQSFFGIVLQSCQNWVFWLLPALCSLSTVNDSCAHHGMFSQLTMKVWQNRSLCI